MNFMEQLINREFCFAEEILSINKLLNESSHKEYYPFGFESIERVAAMRFRPWRHRNNYIELAQMKNGMGIISIINNARKNLGITINEFIYYAEYALNICGLCSKYKPHENINIIIENISNILDYCNYTIELVKEKEVYIIIPKDYETELAINIVKEPNLCENILVYHHHTNKGKVFNKAIILSRLYMYYEKILEKTISSINKTLDNEISELSNKLKIRHDKPNTKEEIIVANMTDEELEYYYDILFALYLRAVILVDNLKVKPELEELRKKLN